VVQITGSGGGDLLTGGSHTVDFIRHLVHDAPAAQWVIGQIDRRPIERKDGRLGFQQWTATHTRYGHGIESRRADARASTCRWPWRSIPWT
jgi:hypothetical protein